ncbi:hypothetical protein LMH87_004039 [Akanthomyces muscarius]|uniref:Uncharacterized protein n=1 Tax=Akanthomyces muscarius TaxID=2231603 RepID=A0A9W8UH93_AKAMU|nr:hypothetical protein LMH87_004039 [Akanthomyces muscarius]KAJ4145183.1 hypothetical protein LMH87_004039 [Akanthomyces muscarius]
MSPSSSVRMARQPRDTGFPEPFGSVRNTTRPHPDADLSPNACIGQDDVHADLVMKRSHRSFLHRSKKHKKTINHGVLSSQLSANPSAISLEPTTTSNSVQQAATTHESQQHQRPHNNSQPSIVETPPSPTASKYARDSFATSRRGDDDETPPTSPDDASLKSHKGLFNKFRRHH